MNQKTVLDMNDITVIYPNGVVANHDVNFQAIEGEIHALMGENGAGKTTLMKVLFGIEQPTEGSIAINGKPVRIESPTHAIQLGIGMVHQHFMLVPKLTVAENIILGMEPTKHGLINEQEARRLVKEAGEKYNLYVDPDARIMDLPVGKKQKVEILKALIRGAKILILDEPTAVLTPQETEELFEQLDKLRHDQHTIIFISHKLNEIKDICDRITIMRNGKSIGVYNVADVSKEDISRLMIGRDVVTAIEKTEAHPTQIALQIHDMCVTNEDGKTTVDHVSLRLRHGEILGIAGVEGNGQREFIDCLSGLQRADQGTVNLCGNDVSRASIHQLREYGLSHIPEDRMVYGVAREESIEDNLISERFEKPAFSIGPLQRRKAIVELGTTLSKEYRIKTDSPKTPVRMLSGGNIQKVVAAREMTSENLEVLIADQPTRGIDVGAAAFIREQLVTLRDQGKAILLISADINEVLELSDSLVVFYEGKINAYFKEASSVSEEDLGLYMLGIKQMDQEEIRRAMA